RTLPGEARALPARPTRIVRPAAQAHLRQAQQAPPPIAGEHLRASRAAAAGAPADPPFATASVPGASHAAYGDSAVSRPRPGAGYFATRGQACGAGCGRAYPYGHPAPRQGTVCFINGLKQLSTRT